MTERSYLWDGTALGDATLAPYDKEEFNKYFHFSVLSTDTEEFVIPGYLNDLKVSPAGNSVSGVKISTGAVLFKNYVYVLDSEITLPIERVTDPAKVRCDLVVIRLVTDQTDTRYQTARFAVIKGAEAAYASTYPVVPSVTQNSQIWEVELARVYVTGLASYIAEGYVHDQRKFLITDKSVNLYDGSYNLIKNSEFMGVSATTTLTGPDGWLGGPVIWTVAAPLFPTKRGQSVRLQSTGGWYQWIPVGNGQKTFTLKGVFLRGSLTDTVTIGVQAIDTLGVRHYPRIYGIMDYVPTTNVEFQETLTFDVDNIEYLEVSIGGNGASSSYFGQFILVPGYHPGPFREFHEVIPFRTPVTDAAWTASAKSSGTTLISLTASFGGRVITGTRAILLRVRGRDSGSAAGTPYLRIRGYAAPFNTYYGTLEIGGVTNDVWREAQLHIPVEHSLWYARSTAPQFRAEVSATGAGTFDATLEVVGIIT